MLKLDGSAGCQIKTQVKGDESRCCCAFTVKKVTRNRNIVKSIVAPIQEMKTWLVKVRLDFCPCCITDSLVTLETILLLCEDTKFISPHWDRRFTINKFTIAPQAFQLWKIIIIAIFCKLKEVIFLAQYVTLQKTNKTTTKKQAVSKSCSAPHTSSSHSLFFKPLHIRTKSIF